MPTKEATLPGYQLVLSRYNGPVALNEYTPDVVFQLYLHPTDVTLKWREPHRVTPVQNGAHVDSGRRVLGDLDIRYTPGAGLRLSSTAQGSPTLADGIQRARELRDFLATADEAIFAGSHRLEFHSDTRDYHVVIIPAENQQAWSAKSTSRVGGAEFTLSYVVVGEVGEGVSAFGQLADTFDGAIAAMRRASGALALSIALVEQTIRVPLQGERVVRDALSQARELVNRVSGVVQGIRALVTLPVRLVRDTALLVSDAKDVYSDLEEFASADVFRQMSDQIDLIWFSLLQSLRESGSAPGGELGAIIAGDVIADDGDFATIIASLTEGDPLIDQAENTSAFFNDFDDLVGQFGGWEPYSAKEGETLIDIAAEQMGDESLWIYLAIINGLTSEQVIAGTVIKVPTLEGGIPFDLDGVTDLQQLQKLLEERLYFRDIKLRDVGQGQIDMQPNVALNDVETVTGIENYRQRYEKVIFRTELGRNKAFPDIGIYLGIGEPRTANVIGLTHASARQQLLADPRTVAVQTREQRELSDAVIVRFDVETVAVEDDTSVVVNTSAGGA